MSLSGAVVPRRHDTRIDEARRVRARILDSFESVIAPIAEDIRDPWPDDHACYTKDTTLSSGQFGVVRRALAQSRLFGRGINGQRRCVIKTLYLRQRLHAILHVIIDRGSPEPIGQAAELRDFIHDVCLDLYILSRCPHANILHLHTVYLRDEDIHVVVPALHSLQILIDEYMATTQYQSMPIAIVARILRQLLEALRYLHSAGVVHRNIDAQHIFLTRNGTVKLGHFDDATYRSGGSTECIGRQAYWSAEKWHNYGVAKGRKRLTNSKDLLIYGSDADIWAVGALALSMIIAFPRDVFKQQLPLDFALRMTGEGVPLSCLVSPFVQLRVRFAKSGGEDLRAFLDRVLNPDAKNRPSAQVLLNSRELHNWCSPNVKADMAFLSGKLVKVVDFSNKNKLLLDCMNYDSLETKAIPVEFYDSELWRELETESFRLTVEPSTSTDLFPFEFVWGKHHDIFSFLQRATTSTPPLLEPTDWFIFEETVDALAFELMVAHNQGTPKRSLKRNNEIQLPAIFGAHERSLLVTLEFGGLPPRDMLGSDCEEDEDIV